ncbi:MAG: universal stress protein [Flavobacteriales bacterium]|nr:universal stress protein [Flavobacteriales bacterium]MCB9203794.1 universal stress protein [Flavobacteriales bacterium]
MKKILVPTDFSDSAYAAAEVAASIAKKTGARVYLLHVVSLLEYGDEEEISKQLFVMKLVRKRMQEMVEQPFFEGVNVVEALQFDLVHENVNKLAIKNEIDLIVMGSHGASGIKEIIFGSNAQKILRRSQCPVLTIKQKPNSMEFKNIVFASNFNPEVEGAFFAIQRFAEIFEAKIHLLRICTVGEFETTKVCHEKMHHLAKETGLRDYTVNVYNNHTLESGVREFTEMINADLVAIATHGRDGLFHILMGSRTEELVNHEHIPILSMTIRD